MTVTSIERVSVDSAGVQGNGASAYSLAISADGRYVAFASTADNLASGDGNGAGWDIFVRDTLTNTTERVSVSSAEVGGNLDSLTGLSISADGRCGVRKLGQQPRLRRHEWRL
jgi:hypothetical protein